MYILYTCQACLRGHFADKVRIQYVEEFHKANVKWIPRLTMMHNFFVVICFWHVLC